MPATTNLPTISQERVDQTAQTIWELENCFDRALVLQAQLSVQLVAAQEEGALSPMFLHEDVFSKLPALGAAIGEARSAALAVHKGLGVMAHRLGLQPSADVSPPGRKPDVVWPWPFGIAAARADDTVSPLRRAG